MNDNKIIPIAIIGLAALIGGYFLLRGDALEQKTAVQQTPSIASNGGQAFAMESKPFSFTPNVIQAELGKSVTINTTSQGKHTFTIDELGINVSTPNEETTVVRFTPNKKGVFAFYCAIPGHKESGQVGTLIVEDRVTPASMTSEKNAAGYYDINSAALIQLFKDKDFALVNVHTPYAGELTNTDAFIPYDAIGQNLGKLPSDKNAKIVLYCRSGSMSAKAAKGLAALGYTNVYNLAGGMNEWEKAGNTIIKESSAK